MKHIFKFAVFATALLCARMSLAGTSFHDAFAERVGQLDATKAILADAGEAAAKRIWENPGAVIHLPSLDCEGFREEMIGRAGGLRYVDSHRRTARDVVLFAVRDWERQAFRVPDILEDYRSEGALVVLFASKAGMPENVHPDFLIDNGAPDGSAKHASVNLLVNATLGWMWCCEYAAAFTREYQVFPGITKSIGANDAWALSTANTMPDGGPRFFRCKEKIPREQPATAYLNRVRKLLSDVQEVPYQRALDKTATIIADRLEKGGRVGMAGLGHLILEETKHDLKSPMLGFRAVSMLPDSFSRALAPGDIIVWITYSGMDSLWDDYGKCIHDAQLEIISSYAQPYFPNPPDGHLAHIPAPWTLPDAEVAIPVAPYCMAPISAINRVLVARALDEAVAAKLKERNAKVEPCTLADPEIFCDTKRRYDSYYIARRVPVPGDRWGFLSSNGVVKMPAIYEAPFRWSNQIGAPAKKDGKFGLIDLETGVTNVPFIFDHISWFRRNQPANVRIGGKWGLYNCASNRWFVKPTYDRPCSYGDGPLHLVPRDGKLVGLDKNGQELPDVSFHRAHYNWRCRNYFFEQDGLWGMTDAEGRTTMKPAFDNLAPLTPENLAFEQNGKYGVIGTNGTILLPPVYDFVKSITRDTSTIVSNCYFGLLDSTTGTILIPPHFPDRITKGPDGKFLGRTDSGLGLYTRTGEVVLPPVYSEIGSVKGDLSIVRKGYSTFLVSLTNGPVPFSENYDVIRFLDDEGFAVQRKGLFGERNADGSVRIPLVYDYLSQGHEHTERIGRRNGKWYLIDNQGKATLFPVDCDYLAPFATPRHSKRNNRNFTGKAAYRVCKNGVWGVADENGKLLLPLEYSYILPTYGSGFAYLAKGGKWRIDAGAYPLFCGAKWGVVDKDGKVLIRPEYDAIAPLGNGWQFLVRPHEAYPVP